MKKVILTIGIQASGKSTWAKGQKKLDEEGTQIVERDEIRLQLDPDYNNKKKWNKAFEKEVTKVQEGLIKLYLTDPITKVIIISDTNLNVSKRIALINKILEVDPDTEIELKPFNDSLNLSLCLERNKKREFPIPDFVVIAAWKKFQSQYIHGEDLLSSGKELVFISDIHSQLNNLKELLKYYSNLDKYYLIFLGDINDSRIPAGLDHHSSFLECYTVVRDLVDSGYATLIHSNHQKNLINALRGKRKKATWGLGETLREMDDIGLIECDIDEENSEITRLEVAEDAIEIANWLDARPYFFKKNNPTQLSTIIGVHAQFLPLECHHPYNVSGKGMEACIYGTQCKRKDGEDWHIDLRNKWWLDYSDSSYEVISGHYHTFFAKPGSHCVIDSGCGQGGPLAAYNQTTKEIQLFGVH